MHRHIHADDADEQRRRRLKRRALATILLMSPWKSLRLHIGMATHDLNDYFDSIDSVLDYKVMKDAMSLPGLKQKLNNSISKLVQAALIRGYDDGGSLVGRKAGSFYIADAKARASYRAQEISDQMNLTTKKWLAADPHNEFALSGQRAERAARYEAARGYYQGMMDATMGEGLLKSWVCLGDDPCEDCLANEEDSPIAMEEVFQSGDYAPLAHLSCNCVIDLSRPEEDAL